MIDWPTMLIQLPPSQREGDREAVVGVSKVGLIYFFD